MSDLYAVPSRVSEGSTSPVPTLSAWREAWMDARDNPDRFWLDVTKSRIHWRTEPTRGLDGGYDTVRDGPFAWFSDGTLNITESCLDRHLDVRGDKTAILWEGDEPGNVRTLTYRELHAEVCKAANALTELGVKKGERVIIYMGMVPEAAVAMLACARVGATHSIIFGGFSPRTRSA